jgi:hypothetical protein
MRSLLLEHEHGHPSEYGRLVRGVAVLKLGGEVVGKRSGRDHARKPMREADAACVVPGPLPDRARGDRQ